MVGVEFMSSIRIRSSLAPSSCVILLLEFRQALSFSVVDDVSDMCMLVSLVLREVSSQTSHIGSGDVNHVWEVGETGSGETVTTEAGWLFGRW